MSTKTAKGRRSSLSARSSPKPRVDAAGRRKHNAERTFASYARALYKSATNDLTRKNGVSKQAKGMIGSLLEGLVRDLSDAVTDFRKSTPAQRVGPRSIQSWLLLKFGPKHGGIYFQRFNTMREKWVNHKSNAKTGTRKDRVFVQSDFRKANNIKISGGFVNTSLIRCGIAKPGLGVNKIPLAYTLQNIMDEFLYEVAHLHNGNKENHRLTTFMMKRFLQGGHNFGSTADHWRHVFNIPTSNFKMPKSNAENKADRVHKRKHRKSGSPAKKASPKKRKGSKKPKTRKASNKA